MVTAFLGIGSNLGDRRKNLEQIIRLLSDTEGVSVIDASSIYITEPVGMTKQKDFYNAVLKIDTSFSPDRLLSACKDVEEALKRKKTKKWGPRTADVDILLYANKKVGKKDLTIPHKEMTKRAFVLVPLNEIDPAVRIPGKGTAASALEKLKSNKRVRKAKGR